MFFANRLKSFLGSSDDQGSAPRPRTRLGMECLEAREVPAAFTPQSPTPYTQTYTAPYPDAPAACTEDSALAPTALTAVAVSQTQIRLSWSSQSQPGAAGYQVDICEWINGAWKEIASTNEATTYTVSNLQPRSTHYFKVGTPDMQFGDGEDYSEVVTRQTPAASAPAASKPAAPAWVNGVVLGRSQIQVAWGQVAGATSYNVYAWTGSTWQYMNTTSATGSTYRNAVPGKTYYFAVNAVNAAGTSTLSPYARVFVAW